MWSMLSSGSPQCSRHAWLLPGCLLRASIARCRRRRQFFSSVGSDSGVPIERQMVRHVLSLIICCSLCAPVLVTFQFFSQLGRTPSVMRPVKNWVISWMVSSLSLLSLPLGFLGSSPMYQPSLSGNAVVVGPMTALPMANTLSVYTIYGGPTGHTGDTNMTSLMTHHTACTTTSSDPTHWADTPITFSFYGIYVYMTFGCRIRPFLVTRPKKEGRTDGHSRGRSRTFLDVCNA